MIETLKQTQFHHGDMTIACQRIENESLTILALHGWQDNSNSFIPLMEQLCEHNWYAIDFPGHGKSSWRNEQAHYYFVDYVDDVFNVIRQIETEKVLIVGHSMGAMVANLFAACFPEWVLGVIAIEGLACVTTPDSHVVKQLRKAIESRNNMKPPRQFNSIEQAASVRQAVSDFDFDIAKLIMTRNLNQVDDSYVLATDPKLKHHSGFRFNQSQAIELCKQTKAPVLLIKGENGYKMIDDAITHYATYYSELSVHSVEGGHHCHMQSPQSVAQLINTFIERIDEKFV